MLTGKLDGYSSQGGAMHGVARGLVMLRDRGAKKG